MSEILGAEMVDPSAIDRQLGDDKNRSQGIALVAVLWISSLLSLLAVGVSSSNSSDLRLAYNAVEQAKARAFADAGVYQALYELMIEPEGQRWQNGKVERQLALEGGSVLFRISDEDSKVDINAASNTLLVGLFRAIGLADGEAHTLVGHLNDIRGFDRAPEPPDTEGYPDLVEGHNADHVGRPFLRISELSRVIGITDEIYQQVRPHVTVYANVDGFDPSRASATTLRALPGVTPELAAEIVAQPAESFSLLPIPEDIGANIDHYLISSRHFIFSIASLGVSDDGGQFVREAVVALDDGTRFLPFSIYTWKRSDTSWSHPKTNDEWGHLTLGANSVRR